LIRDEEKMRYKRIIFAVCVTPILFFLIAVSAAAIDTPWITSIPDEERESESVSMSTTEITLDSGIDTTQEPTQSDSDTTEQPNGSAFAASSKRQDIEQSEFSGDSAPLEESQAPISSQSSSGGCRSTVNGYGWFFIALCGVCGLCRTKRTEERGESVKK